MGGNPQNSTDYGAASKQQPVGQNAANQPSIKSYVKVEKPSLKKKVLGFLFSDKIDSIGSYLTNYILGPSLRELGFRMITGAAQMALFGNGTVQNPNNNNGLVPGWGMQNRPNIINYAAFSQPQPTYVQSPIMPQPAMSMGFGGTNEVTFATKDVANVVLDRMKNVLATYGKCKVADFYRSAEISPPANNWTLESNGWYDLSTAQPIMTTDGRWILGLPAVRQL